MGAKLTGCVAYQLEQPGPGLLWLQLAGIPTHHFNLIDDQYQRFANSGRKSVIGSPISIPSRHTINGEWPFANQWVVCNTIHFCRRVSNSRHALPML